MIIYDIDILEKDPQQEDLYDLTQPTYIQLGGFSVYYYIVEQTEEMRIDLVCNKLYNSTDYVDFLLSFNDIDNPLNIKSGDLILYVDELSIEEFRIVPEKPKVLQKLLLNANKQTKKDNNRQAYVEDNFSLPPTILETPIESVQVKGDQIVIGVTDNTSV